MSEWIDEEDGFAREIPTETHSAAQLPAFLKYRCFGCSQSLKRSCMSAMECHVVKRRRIEYPSSCVDYTQRIVTRAVDSFDVAARQLNTLFWLDQRRSAAEVVDHFNTERRRGVRPSTAATNKALARLEQEETPDAFFDFLEDMIINGDVPAQTTFNYVHLHLRGDVDPLRAASVLHSLITASRLQGPLPVQCCSVIAGLLAEANNRSPLSEESARLFCFYYQLLVSRQVRIPLEVTSSFGNCLLSNDASTAAVQELVRRDIVASLNSDAAVEAIRRLDVGTRVHAGAFLSSFLLRHTVTNRLLLDHLTAACYCCNIPLTERAFERLLNTFFVAMRYDMVVATFLSHCVSSAVISFRSMELFMNALVARDGQPRPLADDVWRRLRTPLPLTLTWVLQVHGAQLFSSSASATRAEMRDGQPSGAQALATTLGSFTGHHVVFLRPLASTVVAVQAAMDAERRREARSSDMSSSPNISSPFGVAALRALRHVRASLVAVRPADDVLAEAVLHAHLRTNSDSALWSPLTPASANSKREVCLASGVSPSTYCNVLCWSAIARMARSETEEKAFLRMMSGYVKKGGALALVVLECFSSDFWAPEMFSLLKRWETHTWFSFVPPSVCTLLRCAGSTSAELYAELIASIRSGGHSKVALFSDDSETVAAAVSLGVSPVIALSELMAKLVK